MSVVEQGSASPSDLEIGVPEFPVALRGYDRQQVDAFVQDLSVRLTAERRRAQQLERAANQMRAELATMRDPTPPSFEHLGAEAGRVLALAGNSAKVLIEEAQTRCREVVDAAEARSAALIERAERRAADLEAEASDTVAQAAAERERILAEASQSVAEIRGQAEEQANAALQHAQDAAERTLEKAASDQTAMRLETERLRESRDRMLDYLGRIHSDLGELLAEAVHADAELAAPANGHLAILSVEDDGEEDDDEEGDSTHRAD
jgi:DivIVA domain-containing protein